jgi:hypothetical protein
VVFWIVTTSCYLKIQYSFYHQKLIDTDLVSDSFWLGESHNQLLHSNNDSEREREKERKREREKERKREKEKKRKREREKERKSKSK